MGKRNINIGKRQSAAVAGNGIMGSGIHGFLGTTIHCNDSDKSAYCSFMKIVNVAIILAFIIFVIALLYIFFIKKRKYKV
jgi:hypothetical protein